MYKGTRCWIWPKSLDRGYGRIRRNGCRVILHRYAYTQEVGPIPLGYVIDHLCSVRSCFNPAHLEAVTTATNNQRAPHNNQYKHRQACSRGHVYTKQTCWQSPTQKLKRPRLCKVCRNTRLRRKRYRERF